VLTEIPLTLYKTLLTLSFLRSNFLSPMRLNKSVRTPDLMKVSIGLSHESDGDILISRSHGFRSESRMTSKPRSSKQFVLGCEHALLIAAVTICSELRIDLMIRS
jgi:hypothetical protein